MATQNPASSKKAVMGNSAGPDAGPASQNGVSIIASGSPLTRLNYFDGKFLRAADLQAEQTYLRTLVELSNQAGGPGVASGYSVELNVNGQFLISPGLAIDTKGRLLLLSAAQTISLADLLKPSIQTANTNGSGAVAFGDCGGPMVVTGLQAPSDFYLLTICHAEEFCGQADVFGKLCEEACVTSTDRPYVVEGIVVRLTPLPPITLPTSTVITFGNQHLRSRVASGYFEYERGLIRDLISKEGLRSEIWCLGAEAAKGVCVPLGVVGVAGSSVTFFDAWTSRRERMDPPAKRYWQWRMRMRPWDVFVAQILQFQCQLRDGIQGGTPGGVTDPCGNTRQLVGEASTVINQLFQFYQTTSAQLTLNAVGVAIANVPTVSIPGGAQYISDLMTRMSQSQASSLLVLLNRLLIRQGIVELPSAGYLPVTPGSALTINQQVRQWMGEGVDLRFCIVTPDYVQHAIEEAQHMERISLTQGLDDPKNKPDVDILVPNGQILARQPATQNLFTAQVNFSSEILTPLVKSGPPFVFAQVSTAPPQAITINGAARAEMLADGGGAFYLGGESPRTTTTPVFGTLAPNAPALLFPFVTAGGGTTASNLEAPAPGNVTLIATPTSATLTPQAGSTVTQSATFNISASITGAIPLLPATAAAGNPPGVFSASLSSLPSGAFVTPATLTVTANPTGLAAGTYTGLFTVGSSQLPSTSAVTVTVTLIVTAPSSVDAQLWASLRCERNVLTMNAGETTPVSMRLTLAGKVNLQSLFDFQLRGDFRADEEDTLTVPNALGPVRIVKGRVSALASLDSTIAGAPNPMQQGGSLVLDATFGVGRTANGPIAILTLGNTAFTFLFEAKWNDGSPLQVNFILRDELFGNRISIGNKDVATGLLVQSADVASTQNSNHKAAVDGIQTLASILNDSGFAVEALRELFPPPLASDTLDVIGTIDWVVFQRRRVKNCGKEEVAALDTRRYRLYLSGRSASFSTNLPAVQPVEIGIVEFPSGTATLLSSVTSLLAAWNKAKPGNLIIMGGIYSLGAAATDGDALAIARLRSVEAALASVSATSPSVSNVIQNTPPASTNTADVDGVIVLMAVQSASSSSSPSTGSLVGIPVLVHGQ